MNNKQQRFVSEYMIDLNATAAAKRAGYSAKTAHVQGPRLLDNVSIAAAIQAASLYRSQGPAAQRKHASNDGESE